MLFRKVAFQRNGSALSIPIYSSRSAEVFPVILSSLADVYRTSRVLTTSLTITPFLVRRPHPPFYPVVDGYCIIIGPLEWPIARPYRSSYLLFFFSLFFSFRRFISTDNLPAKEAFQRCARTQNRGRSIQTDGQRYVAFEFQRTWYSRSPDWLTRHSTRSQSH